MSCRDGSGKCWQLAGIGAMTGRQAELLNDTQVKACLRWCDERRRYPHRDRVVVLLSVRAGLRAVEIARLRRGHVMDDGGGIADVIDLRGKLRLSKKGT